MDRITANIQVKRPISDNKKLGLLTEIKNADLVIIQKTLELKEFNSEMKEDIEAQRDIISRCAKLARDGFEEETHECYASYEKGIAKFVDVQTGEVVEERPITEAEQLRLNEKRIDAEQIIRADSERE